MTWLCLWDRAQSVTTNRYLQVLCASGLGTSGLRNPAPLSQATTEVAHMQGSYEAGATGLEPATSGVTGRRSNQLNYAPGDGPV
jgi:hypothetical protein